MVYGLQIDAMSTAYSHCIEHRRGSNIHDAVLTPFISSHKQNESSAISGTI